MNILFVSDVSVSQIVGGAERVLFEQCRRLVQRGHSVHVLTRRLYNHNRGQQCIEGIYEWRYRVDNRNPATFLLSTLKNSRQLYRELKFNYHFDIINFHQPFSASGIIGPAKREGIPTIYTCHSLSFEEYQTRNAESAGICKNAIRYANILTRKFIERYILKRVGQIVVLSRYSAEKLKKAYCISGGKVIVNAGGVDTKRFHPLMNRSLIRQKLRVPEDKIILLTVRNLVPRMGLENLISAVKMLRTNLPQIYLVICGEGPLKDRLESMAERSGIADIVHFSGYVSEHHLPKYYQVADFFILPTIDLEGFGMVTLEAMASGLPVLGTPVGGTVEILTAFDPDFLFTDITPHSMASKIESKVKAMTEEPSNWQSLSSRCRDFVIQNYSWEKNIDMLEQLMASE